MLKILEKSWSQNVIRKHETSFHILASLIEKDVMAMSKVPNAVCKFTKQ
jgi:hypothetical protein